MPTILFVLGTRPEAIKLCPLIGVLRRDYPKLAVRVCITAQHRELLDQALSVFGVRPDYDLGVMSPGQTLTQAAARILAALEPVIAAERPALTIVQGDTTTTFCGALAAFYQGVPVGHVEAGLRTGDRRAPFPEEVNRVLTGRLADLHFAATEWAAGNLRREGVPETGIYVTGNTGIDAVLDIAARLEDGQLAASPWPWLNTRKRLLLVTAHRRESFGEGFERICTALADLAARGDTQIVYPVHPNPSVSGPVRSRLGNVANLVLVEPLSYIDFVDLMRRSFLLITDSGGVQEEAPSLGKPVLVMRDKTERPEAVEAGTARLVGTDPAKIQNEANRLLDDPREHAARSRIHNPYGDGHASERIARIIQPRVAP